MQETPQDKRRAGEDFSGTVVVLLDEQVPPGTDDTPLVHARRSGLDQLVELLLALGNPPTERQVTSVRVQELVEAERARLDGLFPPLRSLTRYWRVDVVVPDRLLTPGDDPFFLDQRYLQPAPDGVDAVAAWGFRGGRGEGVQFVDVEEAWRWTHDDLDALGVTLLCNTNRDGRNGFPGDHGNATLGVVAGVDNTVGVVGIAPRLDRVLVASHFKQKGYYVVDALAAVGTVVRSGDVVLLEVQRAGLPPRRSSPTSTRSASSPGSRRRTRGSAWWSSRPPATATTPTVSTSTSRRARPPRTPNGGPGGPPTAARSSWGPVGRRPSTGATSAGASPTSAPTCTATRGATAWSPRRRRAT